MKRKLNEIAGEGLENMIIGQLAKYSYGPAPSSSSPMPEVEVAAVPTHHCARRMVSPSKQAQSSDVPMRQMSGPEMLLEVANWIEEHGQDAAAMLDTSRNVQDESASMFRPNVVVNKQNAASMSTTIAGSVQAEPFNLSSTLHPITVVDQPNTASVPAIQAEPLDLSPTPSSSIMANERSRLCYGELISQLVAQLFDGTRSNLAAELEVVTRTKKLIHELWLQPESSKFLQLWKNLLEVWEALPSPRRIIPLVMFEPGDATVPHIVLLTYPSDKLQPTSVERYFGLDLEYVLASQVLYNMLYTRFHHQDGVL